MEQLKYLMDMAERISNTVNECLSDEDAEKELGIGADGYPTKVLDKRAEDAALDYMKETGLPWSVNSEEIGVIKGSKEELLILDPVDGTYNAVSGIHFFSTSLALMNMKQGKITAGVVKNICTGNTYYAVRGEGAYLDSQRIRTRTMREGEMAISAYIGPEVNDWIRELVFWPRRMRYMGCISLEMCLVASGGLDMFIMSGRMPRFTDIAAASIILEEAGGKMVIMDSEKRWRDFYPSFEWESISAFFAVGDPTSLKRVQEISKAGLNPWDK